ncbi:Uncharacterized protein Fot_40680 [Forsythia ovata]|uniref:Uncharacterized protein n=1 Tax=Forsythia ovata TaxID=205694 RepID=A0ABD1S847_9LAMI
MENMSVEQLRALKEQADLEFNFFQETTSAPHRTCHRQPRVRLLQPRRPSPPSPRMFCWGCFTDVQRTEYLDSQEYFDNTREWLHLWGVFLSGIEGADSTTVFYVASNVQTARGTLVLNTDDVIRE